MKKMTKQEDVQLKTHS